MAKKKNNFKYTTNLFRLISYYKTLALNIYRWEGLPDGIESKYIEQFLYEYGQVAFTYDNLYGYIALPCSQSLGVNIYGEPIGYVITGSAGYYKQVKADECVRIENNDLCIPTMVHINHYAKKMNEIEETMAQNLRQQKFPYMIAGSKNNEFSIKAVWNQIANGEDAIFIDKKWEDDGDLKLQAIPTLSPYLLDKLQIHKLDLERELLTFLGLDCVVEKKERLIADEANSNSEQILMSLDLGFKSRQEACELINKKYGLNVSVKKVINDLVIEDFKVEAEIEDIEMIKEEE